MAAKKRSTRKDFAVKVAIAESMSRLAFVRDALRQIEAGNFNGMTAQDYAFFVRAGMEEAAVKLEETLVFVGLIKAGDDYFTEAHRG